eukprot:544451-Pelagomonas_calceolata.AAC.5
MRPLGALLCTQCVHALAHACAHMPARAHEQHASTWGLALCTMCACALAHAPGWQRLSLFLCTAVWSGTFAPLRSTHTFGDGAQSLASGSLTQLCALGWKVAWPGPPNGALWVAYEGL